MSRVNIVCIVYLFLFSASALGQITIGTNDFQPIPGTVLTFPEDQAMDETHFNNLSAGTGGPMVWDFTARTFAPAFSGMAVDLGTTPAIGSFPTANSVIMSIVGPDTSWLVYNSVSASYTQLGSVYHGSGVELVWPYTNQTTEFNFPLSYNDQWTSYRHLTTFAGVLISQTFDTATYSVDAWGTAVYSTNSFPCLRVKCVRRIVTEFRDSSNTLFSSTTQDVTNVFFIAAGFNRVVNAAKVSFMGSDIYSSSATGEFTDLSTDVARDGESALPRRFTLGQNYPNPFNPSTVISYGLPEAARVTVAVYNLLGKRVKLYDQGMQPAGEHSVTWSATDERGKSVASGLYFYRVSVGGFAITRKMLLLQ